MEKDTYSRRRYNQEPYSADRAPAVSQRARGVRVTRREDTFEFRDDAWANEFKGAPRGARQVQGALFRARHPGYRPTQLVAREAPRQTDGIWVSRGTDANGTVKNRLPRALMLFDAGYPLSEPVAVTISWYKTQQQGGGVLQHLALETLAGDDDLMSLDRHASETTHPMDRLEKEALSSFESTQQLSAASTPAEEQCTLYWKPPRDRSPEIKAQVAYMLSLNAMSSEPLNMLLLATNQLATFELIEARSVNNNNSGVLVCKNVRLAPDKAPLRYIDTVMNSYNKARARKASL
jgi:hypothetical protein